MTELWHCTRLDHLDLILQQGIMANHPEQREHKPKGVYLSEYRFNWMWNTQREGRVKGACIKVDVDGLELLNDFHDKADDAILNSKTIGKDFIYLGNIPPCRIKEVWIETDPNVFQPIRLNKMYKRVHVSL